MSASRKARNRKARNIVITPKGYAILALIERGAYKYLSSADAKLHSLRRINKARRKMRRESVR